MDVLKRLVSVVTSVALALGLVGLGLGACLLPPVTHLLANAYSQDSISPFNRTQLVKVADATREYCFGAHDELSLYQTIYGIDEEYRASIKKSGGGLDRGFPDLDYVTDKNDAAQYKTIFAKASEMYCYSANTMSHLDDCHAVIVLAAPLLIASGIIAIGGLIVCGMLGRKRLVGGTIMSSGVVVLVCFIALGIWAAVDFTGLFTAFHNLFFSQGNWAFPYDSLLICALPTEFWMGMGVVWLIVALIASILSFVVGLRLRKK